MSTTQRKIKTAEEHIRDITANERTKKAQEKARREHQRKLEEDANVRDIRDATIAHIKNSGRSYQSIEDLGGPVVKTLMSWQEEKTINPRMTTIRRALRCIGKDIGIVDYRR